MDWTGKGHEQQKAYFETLMTEGKLGHAYLFAGPDMIGKRQVAEDIARHLIPAGYELDVFRLAPERDEETGKIHDIAIDETKKLKAWISLRPTSQHKVVLIDAADRLGGEAANNLLKVLEEPPAYAHFFLMTSQPGQVMDTIASRCERVDFLPSADQPLPPLSKTALALASALKKSIPEKIAYAKQLADDDQASEAVLLLLRHVHAQLIQKPYLGAVAHGLLDLLSVLAEPQYNRRLAIEHFLLTNHLQN